MPLNMWSSFDSELTLYWPILLPDVGLGRSKAVYFGLTGDSDRWVLVTCAAVGTTAVAQHQHGTRARVRGRSRPVRDAFFVRAAEVAAIAGPGAAFAGTPALPTLFWPIVVFAAFLAVAGGGTSTSRLQMLNLDVTRQEDVQEPPIVVRFKLDLCPEHARAMNLSANETVFALHGVLKTVLHVGGPASKAPNRVLKPTTPPSRFGRGTQP
ncbi:hypothetical protein AURDEDRAFT_175086 [Auricularia subglabra TFB-10046 SS5]|uniref:Uncharacterized protein n=1 Tax=Auricularia subglabra (strain TFB-10046 / SS5) TaxID=717982 RepID=J0WTL6_AURST|nr:hypothetical protein AURDEDRAFT_175086 [Auricularia subglabra TFB-10046 SS5]